MQAVRVPEEQPAPREFGLPGHRAGEPGFGPQEAHNAFWSSSTSSVEKKCFEDCAQRVFSRQVVSEYPVETGGKGRYGKGKFFSARVSSVRS